eukprot:7539974-Alexandrium_andersonii.AAC.1
MPVLHSGALRSSPGSWGPIPPPPPLVPRSGVAQLRERRRLLTCLLHAAVSGLLSCSRLIRG